MSKKDNIGYEEFMNGDKTVITLPVPIGATVYEIKPKCGRFCLMQKELFNKNFPEHEECDWEDPCQTRPASFEAIELTFDNLAYVLSRWGKSVFATKDEASFEYILRMNGNRERMEELGFQMDEFGDAIPDENGLALIKSIREKAVANGMAEISNYIKE